MIIAGILASVAVLALVAWWLARNVAERGKHAGAGEGALLVQHLLDQADAEDEPGGRHRLREPVVMHGDLPDELAVLETRLLPRAEAGLPFDDRDALARHPWTFRHVLDGL
ncbi:hypothetical protein AB0I53_27670 [Saccharopolyspora sp. NPDC050389]|uniref:hypothetical protein n=1 Tax=Saccharopolyspora sp. NPDC050389 TaxID=3155516 RepID=UPI0033EAA0BD